MILLIGDVHLGNVRADLPALLELLLRARSPSVEAVAIAGDVIDNVNMYNTQAHEQPPSPLDAQEKLFSWFIKILREVGREGANIYVAYGNHDRTAQGNLLGILCRGHGVECNDYMLLDSGRLLVIHSPYRKSSSTFNNTPLAAMHLLESIVLDQRFKDVKVIVAGHTHSRFTVAHVGGKYYIVLPALLEPKGVHGVRPKVVVGVDIFYSDTFLDIIESPGYPHEHRQACLHKLLSELVQGRVPGLEESAELCGVR